MTLDSQLPGPEPRGYRRLLILLLLVSALFRLAYVAEQAHSDPLYDQPLLDGQVYLEWAAAIASGEVYETGAFYHAPLYPYLLAWTFMPSGAGYGVLYAGQQLLVVLAAGLLASVVRRRAGGTAALAAAALFLFYAPLVYFPSRPLAEALAIVLLLAALAWGERLGTVAEFSAGLLAGLAALARPNLLLVPLAWACFDLLGARRRRGALILAGLLVAVVPVAVRNRAATGHWVPISSNAGLTAYHGNGPGAIGIFTLPTGFSGDVRRQRDEAVALARRATGAEFDAVEADRWWGRRAVETRLADPAGTLRLLLARALLLFDSYEHGLDYPPTSDTNPLRLTWRLPRDAEVALVPFGLLVGFAAAGLLRRGWAATGGAPLWLAVAAAAATPMLFYMSSRYRLPLAALLAAPAGVGLAALVTGAGRGPRRAAWVVALACAALSLAVPSERLQILGRAAAASNRVGARLAGGDLEGARRDAEEAIRLDPQRAAGYYNLGLVLEGQLEMDAAERAYRDALLRSPALVPAAHRLARLLLETGRPVEALAVARRTLLRRPDCEPCWSDAVAAHLDLNDPAAARRASDEARRRGLRIEPGLLERLDAAGAS